MKQDLGLVIAGKKILITRSSLTFTKINCKGKGRYFD